MYELKYHRALSTNQAVSIIGDAEDGKFIAGGQTLIPTMKQRLAAPSDLVDISQIADLNGISISEDKIVIGACTTHADVAANSDLRSICSALCDLAGTIGDPAVRNKGTIGGSIANNDPAADYPAALMALDARIITNLRKFDCDEFFTGLFETALREDEIIISITFSAPVKAAYCKFPNPASRYAMAGVFVAKLKNGMTRVGVTGAGSDGVFRHLGMENALAKDWTPEAISGETVLEEDMLADMHGDGAYRANLVKVMAKRAIAAAQ